MKRPVILLTFANDRDNYLPMIKRERKNIARSLRSHDEKDAIKLVSEGSSTLEDIYELFHTYDNQVAIFHFGGHAGGTHLRLEQADSSTATTHAVGLAQLLGQQQNLQLVFLNGCATEAQVQLLLKEGVRAVIATSVPVQDQMATEFAEQFYYALASHIHIRRAFNIAKSFIVSKYQNPVDIEIYRDFVFQDHPGESATPWGLYLHPDTDTEKFWSLPKLSSQKQVLKTRFDYETRADVNDILIDTMCDEVAKYNNDLVYELNKENFDIPSIKREIVDSFPTPIGEQLRRLFTRSNNPAQPDDMERFTLARLEQISMTFRTSTQFISFILLSQLWDAKKENPDLLISEDYIVSFNSFFALNRHNANAFDYVKMIRTITDLFDEHQIPYFIEELKAVKVDAEYNRALYDAYTFMNSLYQQILDGTIAGQSERVESLCLEAEAHLGIVLHELAFLVKYKLATIKNIELIKDRHAPAKYRHTQILLNQALTVASTGITEVGVEFENYSDSKCVVFLKTKDNQIEDFLNLSPFIIDENALNSDYSTKLYLYGFQDGDSYCYHFLSNLKDEPMQVNKERYAKVSKQFDRFKAEIFGLEYIPRTESKSSHGGSFLRRKRQ